MIIRLEFGKLFFSPPFFGWSWDSAFLLWVVLYSLFDMFAGWKIADKVAKILR